MNYENPIHTMLREKGTIYGAGIHVRDIAVADIFGRISDFLWIDMEHTWLDRGAIFDNIIAARSAGAASIVRAPWNDMTWLKPILEFGPDAVAIPQICSLEEAKKAMYLCTYPPTGGRGWGPRRAKEYGLIPAKQYHEEALERTLIFLQIESYKCIDKLDEIAELEGLGGICVGPQDLAASMGKICQIRDPEVMEAYDEIGRVMKRHPHIPFMVSLGFNTDNIADWKRRGCNIMHVCGDTEMLLSEGQRQIQIAKELGCSGNF